MRPLPVADPGTADDRSATRYLLWLTRIQLRTVALGVALGIVWMASQALMPAVIGRAIDAGISQRDGRALLSWAGVMLALALVTAASGIMRHRTAVFNWLSAAYRTIQLTVRQANRLGAALPTRLPTGEVVSIGTADISHVGGVLDITARGAGAIVAIVVVSVIMLTASVPLGLVVVVGVPVIMAVSGLLIKPLHHRQQAYRDESGELTNRANDIVAGLRVLRGIGGERVFSARYRDESQRLRRAGVRVAPVESVLEATQVFAPGLFVVLVTWLGARFALSGQITIGQLVAFYGYAAFMVSPLRTLTEALDKLTRGHVAARRVVRVLSLRPSLAEPERSTVDLSWPPAAGELRDPESGLVVPLGQFTAVATAQPADAGAIADRLGRYTDGAATLAGVPLRDLPVATVRDWIMVADNDARLFSGPLRAELAAGRRAGEPVDDAGIWSALWSASATDVVAALPGGLDAEVTERGREFSGGQQQRLRLVRALLADRPVLVLVEPTSAVDAHTEAAIAARLGAARRGRTTVVCTTSPLMLDRADRVAYVEDGRVVAEGTHRELLDREPRYAATVTRGEDEA